MAEAAAPELFFCSQMLQGPHSKVLRVDQSSVCSMAFASLSERNRLYQIDKSLKVRKSRTRCQ